MNKAKKAIRTLLGRAQVGPVDHDEVGETADLAPAPPEPTKATPPILAALLEVDTGPLTGLEAGFQKLKTFASEERRHRARMDQAKRDYDKVKRRWERKLPWVVEGKAWDGPQSLWRHASEVKRDEGRLAAIDSELQTARRFYVHCRGKWLRWRTFARLLDSRDRSTPEDPALLDRFIERARERAVEARIPSDLGRVIDMWPGLGHNIFEWNAILSLCVI